MAKKDARKPKRSTAPTLKVISGGKAASDERDEQQKAGKARPRRERTSHGKRVQFDPETWQALDLLARDRMMTFQELADEAFRDLLQKHGRPTDLKDALRRSLRDADPARRSRHSKTRPHGDEH